MAGKSKKWTKKGALKDFEGGNFGNYEEDLGGGTPVGGSYKGRSGRIGWQVREDAGEVGEGDHREEQPRTADGKFTYNSVNGKETKYDGRGKTVNPLFTGGVNGIKIDDVKAQFEAQSGKYWDQFKDKWFRKTSTKITGEGNKHHFERAQEDIWEVGKYCFSEELGEFDKEKGLWKGAAGRPTEAARKQAQEAVKSRKEDYVRDTSGAITIKGGKTIDDAVKAIRGLEKKTLVHPKAQIDAARKMLEDAGNDTSNFTDEQIDQIMDEFFEIK